MNSFKSIFLLSFIVCLIAGCSEMEIQPDSLHKTDDSSLKSAKVKYVPFKSEFNTWGVSEVLIFDEGTPIGVHVVVEGIGKATHLGKTEITVDQDWYFGYPMTGESFITLKAANGDLLYLTFEGEMYPFNSNTYFEISGSCRIEGGTGRFLDAEGEILTLNAVFDKNKGDLGEGETFILGELSY